MCALSRLTGLIVCFTSKLLPAASGTWFTRTPRFDIWSFVLILEPGWFALGLAPGHPYSPLTQHLPWWIVNHSASWSLGWSACSLNLLTIRKDQSGQIYQPNTKLFGHFRKPKQHTMWYACWVNGVRQRSNDRFECNFWIFSVSLYFWCMQENSEMFGCKLVWNFLKNFLRLSSLRALRLEWLKSRTSQVVRVWAANFVTRHEKCLEEIFQNFQTLRTKTFCQKIPSSSFALQSWIIVNW